MKKLNKRGFTLIELLAVLVILVVIMAIAIPSVTSSIERSKNKEKNMKIKLIESEAELYIDRNNYAADTEVTITIPYLIDNSSLRDSEIVDPDNSNRTLCGFVICKNNKCTFTENSTNVSDYCKTIE